jgi:hypothetical protein
VGGLPLALHLDIHPCCDAYFLGRVFAGIILRK